MVQWGSEREELSRGRSEEWVVSIDGWPSEWRQSEKKNTVTDCRLLLTVADREIPRRWTVQFKRSRRCSRRGSLGEETIEQSRPKQRLRDQKTPRLNAGVSCMDETGAGQLTKCLGGRERKKADLVALGEASRSQGRRVASTQGNAARHRAAVRRARVRERRVAVRQEDWVSRGGSTVAGCTAPGGNATRGRGRQAVSRRGVAWSSWGSRSRSRSRREWVVKVVPREKVR